MDLTSPASECCHCVCAQAATETAAAVNELESVSTEMYRLDKADAMWPLQLEKVCGKNGIGGPAEFVVKKRPPGKGGDWTFAQACKVRSLKKGSVYRMGCQAHNPCTGRYDKLYKLIIGKSHAPPSGWQNADVFHAMLYNLREDHEKQKRLKRARAHEQSPTRAAKQRRTTAAAVDDAPADDAGAVAGDAQANDATADDAAAASPTGMPAGRFGLHRDAFEEFEQEFGLGGDQEAVAEDEAGAVPAPERAPTPEPAPATEHTPAPERDADAAEDGDGDEVLHLTEHELEAIKSGAVQAVSQADLESFEAKHEPFFLTWKMMGPLGSNSAWLKTNPNPRKEGAPNTSRVHQREEKDQRREVHNAAGNSNAGSGQSDLTSSYSRASREVHELAQKMLKTRIESLANEKKSACLLFNELKTCLQGPDLEQARKEFIDAMKKPQPTYEYCLEQVMADVSAHAK